MSAPAASFPRLFEPLRLGHLELRNRICSSAHADALAKSGVPGEQSRRYYAEKAEGGLGLQFCFGSASVHPSSPARDWKGVELFDDRVIPHLARFAEAHHAQGVPVVAQITHRGRRGRSEGRFGRLHAPSPIREPNHRETPHPLDSATIEEFVRAYADAAGRLLRGGFDGCEVMASHGHLIDQFWSPLANRRDDEWGGDIDGRMRFGVRVIEAIRQRCGEGFLVGIRMTGDDFLEGGLDGAAAREIAARLDAIGLLDYYSVVGSTAETFVGEALAVPDMSFPHAAYASLAGAIKQIVRAPVVAAGRIVTPAEAEAVLAAGHADLVIMTRALIADPELPIKARAGEASEVRLCRGYNQGCIDRIYTGLGVTCVQNARLGRETEFGALEPSPHPRRVVVAGGGGAGLEAARVARLRGHAVVLMEQAEQLGGQTLIGARAPGRREYRGATDWIAAQCEKLGVEIRLGARAEPEAILATGADVVVVATGARAHRPELQGIESALDAWSVLAGDVPSARHVAVVDEEYGFQAPGVAEALLDRGARVDIVTSMEAIGSLLGATTRPPIYRRLFEKGVRIHPHLHVRAVHGDKIVVENAWTGSRSELGSYDRVVYAYGGEALDELSAALRGRVECAVVGDAFAPRTLQHAILEGHRVGREI